MEAPRAPEHACDEQPMQVVIDWDRRLARKTRIVCARPAPCPPARRRFRSRRRSLLARRRPVHLPELIGQRLRTTSKSVRFSGPRRPRSVSRRPPNAPFRPRGSPWRPPVRAKGFRPSPSGPHTSGKRPVRARRLGLPQQARRGPLAPRRRKGYARRGRTRLRPADDRTASQLKRLRRGRLAGPPGRKPRLRRSDRRTSARSDDAPSASEPPSSHKFRDKEAGRNEKQGEYKHDGGDVPPDRATMARRRIHDFRWASDVKC